jgi:hypothetical protein
MGPKRSWRLPVLKAPGMPQNEPDTTMFVGAWWAAGRVPVHTKRNSPQRGSGDYETGFWIPADSSEQQF